jgi:hypothetical protein
MSNCKGDARYDVVNMDPFQILHKRKRKFRAERFHETLVSAFLFRPSLFQVSTVVGKGAYTFASFYN